ncbi:405_t:CDS:2 [Paraglomus brasilianum]|uniref:405_t:CDS:1 n=1 Tax=Paraglomus brasilianum TaxID=144538 RepID=A0A9N8VI19_9GLOM|nr:405_t:CDS:2 [Paraglomus brasilianum]
MVKYGSVGIVYPSAWVTFPHFLLSPIPMRWLMQYTSDHDNSIPIMYIQKWAGDGNFVW